jgi:hypothetical protein
VDGADEEEYDPEAELEPQPEPTERQTAQDRRQALLQLAKKVCTCSLDTQHGLVQVQQQQ